MDSLLPILNKVQDLLTNLETPHDLRIPQLVVVGSQSAGKSSVLEHIVGRDFLPRGSDVVTRRPLVIALVKTEGKEEYGEFLHRSNPQTRYEDFSEIRKEIIRETVRVTGMNKGISNAPIHLKIYSPNVVNLTLVDLPGITKVPMGDQPADIEAQIYKMVLSYVKNPNAVIVAVSPANADLANSEALKVARRVDPEGKRTIGVITKLDLMDKGTDATEILAGNIIPLHHGYIGVVNRSQHDIDMEKPIHEALEFEKEYFRTHPQYGNMADKMGTIYLGKRLNSILLSHICETLPELRIKIAQNMHSASQELDLYGKPIPQEAKFQAPVLLQLLSKFATGFSDSLDGRVSDIHSTELYGGARICFVFHELFAAEMAEVQPFDVLTDDEIRTAICNSTGSRPSLFIPEISFELLVKKQIERLLAPSLRAIDVVFQELKRVAIQCESLVPELIRFPNLRERLFACVSQLLESHLDPTRQIIHSLLDIELAYINTSHPDFIGGSKAVAKSAEELSILQEESSKNNNNKQQNNNNNHNNIRDDLPSSFRKQTNSHPSKHHREFIRRRQKSEPQLNIIDSNIGQHKTIHAISSRDIYRDNNESNNVFFNRFLKQKNNSGQILHNMNITSMNNNNDYNDYKDSNDPNYNAFDQAFADVNVLTSSQSAMVSPAMTPINSHRTIQSIRNMSIQQQQNKLNGQFDASTLPMSIINQEPSERDIIEVHIIKSLITSYFDITKKKLQDSIPKAIMCFLVNRCKRDLQSELVKELYKETQFTELLMEYDNLQEKRQACERMVKVMNAALDTLNQVKDLGMCNS